MCFRHIPQETRVDFFWLQTAVGLRAGERMTPSCCVQNGSVREDPTKSLLLCWQVANVYDRERKSESSRLPISEPKQFKLLIFNQWHLFESIVLSMIIDDLAISLPLQYAYLGSAGLHEANRSNSRHV